MSEGGDGGRGNGRDYCPSAGAIHEERASASESAVCRVLVKAREKGAARLINRVLSSSNWQSSNNHLEAPPVNPELIHGVTVRHSYHPKVPRSSPPPPRLASLGSWRGVERARLSLAFFAPRSCFPARRVPPPLAEIFNSSPSFAFDLNFFNRPLKTGTTFQSAPRSTVIPAAALLAPPRAAPLDLFRARRYTRRKGTLAYLRCRWSPGLTPALTRP